MNTCAMKSIIYNKPQQPLPEVQAIPVVSDLVGIHSDSDKVRTNCVQSLLYVNSHHCCVSPAGVVGPELVAAPLLQVHRKLHDVVRGITQPKVQGDGQKLNCHGPRE